MSNILDKPLESTFGYIQVLPGAFSAYRYAALRNSSPNAGPLASYFRGETIHNGDADVFSANMYLAEDRILCFELVTKRNENWVLKYVKDASAETDVPAYIPELVSQRRRWLNGSFFAAVHALTHCSIMFRSGHSKTRKTLFGIQVVYNLVNLGFSWFAIANFYLTFYFLFSGVNDENTDPFGGGGKVVFQVLQELYVGAIAVQFLVSFGKVTERGREKNRVCATTNQPAKISPHTGNRPQGFKPIYYFLPLFFAIFMGFLLYAGFFLVKLNIDLAITRISFSSSVSASLRILLTTPAFRDIIVSLASTYGMYVLASVVHMDVAHVGTSMVQYLVLLPTYTHVFMVYACEFFLVLCVGEGEVRGEE
ncbi:Chitin synthase, class 2 [Borealophlyctis nickersoniae]|nr:Chitin synthase, class 2 [Borealophlyctis nickersoniae]